MRWRDGFDSSTSCARFVRRCRWLIFWEASRIVFLFHFYGSLQFRFWCACEHKKLIYCRFHGTFGLAVNGVPLTFRRYDFMRSMPRMCNPLKSFSFCIGNPADSISWFIVNVWCVQAAGTKSIHSMLPTPTCVFVKMFDSIFARTRQCLRAFTYGQTKLKLI